MQILEQIGSSFKTTSVSPPAGNYNTIQFAITTFGYDLIDSDAKKLYALIALRNAFTHDFNLVNKPQNPQHVALQQHKFTVDSDPFKENEIVKLPSVQWDGDIIGKKFNNTSDATFINLFAFGTLVEKMVNRIIEMVKKNQIDTIIPVYELINKYTFVTSNHPINIDTTQI